MASLKMATGLDLPSDPDRRLDAVLAAGVGKTGCKPAASVPADTAYWDARHFDLHGTRAFRSMSAQQQAAVLERASRGLLEEAYFIEKAGMAYAAKMSLTSQTTEERVLYSLIAADEACHFAQVSSYLGAESPDAAGNPFLQLLSELIETGDRQSLIFTIQVVLEGWGLTHYRSIATDCKNADLAAALQGVLRDEARHHGSGMLLFDAASLTSKSRRFIVEVMTRFLAMVRLGPQGVVGAVSSVADGLTKRQRVELFADLNAFDHSASRLSILRTLMVRAGAESIVDALRSAGAFTPMSAAECAA